MIENPINTNTSVYTIFYTIVLPCLIARGFFTDSRNVQLQIRKDVYQQVASKRSPHVTTEKLVKWGTSPARSSWLESAVSDIPGIATPMIWPIGGPQLNQVSDVAKFWEVRWSSALVCFRLLVSSASLTKVLNPMGVMYRDGSASFVPMVTWHGMASEFGTAVLVVPKRHPLFEDFDDPVWCCLLPASFHSPVSLNQPQKAWPAMFQPPLWGWRRQTG